MVASSQAFISLGLRPKPSPSSFTFSSETLTGNTFSLLPASPTLDGRVWYNKRRKNHGSGLHLYPVKGPAPSSPPYQMLINHGLPRSKAGDTRSKSTKWRVMAAYQNNNKKHEKFSKSRRKKSIFEHMFNCLCQ